MAREQHFWPDADRLRRQAQLLVRPGEVPGGGGWLRIGKDQCDSPARMLEATVCAAGAGGRVLLSVNQEGGRLNAVDWPQAVQFPGAAALGAAGSVELAEEAGAGIGGQLRSLGLCWNLAPVCDLASEPMPAAVAGRSFGADPQRAGRLAAGFVRGLQGAGVAATAKHFPGLGGVAADPHHQVAGIDRLRAGALVPFEAAVEAGVASVMVGSHIIRDLDSVPALASTTVVGLLRSGIGFDGVIVSENLSLPSVHGPLGGLVKAAVAAIAAGVDVVMLDSEISRAQRPADLQAGARRRSAVVDALVDAVLTGRLDPDRLEQSARRVATLEDRFAHTPTLSRPTWQDANSRAEQSAERIAAASVNVVRGAHLLPLDTGHGPLAVVRVANAGDRKADSARHAPDLLPELLAGPHSLLPTRPDDPLPGGASAVVIYGYDTGRGSDGVSVAARCANRMAGRGLPVVQIAFGDAGDLTGSTADVLVAAWSPYYSSAAATVCLLTGRTRGTGMRPGAVS